MFKKKKWLQQFRYYTIILNIKDRTASKRIETSIKKTTTSFKETNISKKKLKPASKTAKHLKAKMSKASKEASKQPGNHQSNQRSIKANIEASKQQNVPPQPFKCCLLFKENVLHHVNLMSTECRRQQSEHRRNFTNAGETCFQQGVALKRLAASSQAVILLARIVWPQSDSSSSA